MLWPADWSKDTLPSGAVMLTAVSERWLSKPSLSVPERVPVAVPPSASITTSLLPCVLLTQVADPFMITFWLG
jgi:hypothetical protein